MKELVGLNPKYWGFFPLTDEQYNKLLELGEINERYIVLSIKPEFVTKIFSGEKNTNIERLFLKKRLIPSISMQVDQSVK